MVGMAGLEPTLRNQKRRHCNSLAAVVPRVFHENASVLSFRHSATSTGLIMNRALSFASLVLCLVACATGRPNATPRIAVNNVVVDGNSLSKSLYGVREMPEYIPPASAAPMTLTNVARLSATTTELIQDAIWKVDPLLVNGANNVLVFWEGTNDLYFGVTPEQTYLNIKTYVNARRAAGWKVAVLTLLPRHSRDVPANFEESRQYVNHMLRTHWLTFAHTLIDVGADHIMGDPDTIWNANWYQAVDNTHLAEPGSQRIGKLIGIELQPLFR